MPDVGEFSATLDGIATRIASEGGTVYRYLLDTLSVAQHARLVDEWNALRAQEFAEIVEECETKFAREVEFEIFRANLTAGEAEEIEADLEKIRAWFARVVARDCFAAANRGAAEAAIRVCEELLDDFMQRVYLTEMADGPALAPPLALAWDDFPRATTPAIDEKADPDAPGDVKGA